MSTESQAAPPAAPSVGPGDDASSADMAAVFGLDIGHISGNAEEQPPAPAPAPTEPTPPAAPAAPTPPAAPTEPAPAQAPADPNASPLPAPAQPAAQPAPVPGSPEAALEAASLRAQIDALQRDLAAARAPAPATPAPTPSAGTAQPETDPQYALTIPADVTAAIFGEDANAAQGALTHLINSLAKHIHKTVAADYTAKIAALQTSSVAQQEAQQAAEQARAMQETYFGKFPQHNMPTLLPILQQEAAKLAAQFPQASVDDNWYNALGSRVNAAIAAITGQPAPAAPAPVVPPAKPAAMVPMAPTRPAPNLSGEAGDDLNNGDSIMSVFTSG